jgi:hypothetical protein
MWRFTLNESRNVVQTQQRRIRLLTTCLIISISVCYLHQLSSDERAQLEEALPQIGETSVISFIAVGIFFYLLRSFAGLKGVLDSVTNLFEGFWVSTLSAMTTIITVVLVSFFTGQVPLAIPQIALLLFSNAIVWPFELSIQMVTERFWRKLRGQT